MLEEIGVPYRVEPLAFATTMKSPQYLAINAMGKVPALRHGDVVVTECAAICAYLADAFPQAQLAPPPAERGAYYRWLFFAAGPLEAAITDRALGVEPTDAQRGFVGYGSFDAVVDTVDRALAGREHIAGRRFSAADVYVGASVAFALQFGSLPRRDSFAAYADRLAQRPARRRALRLDDELLAAMR
ncbi:glutathione S-transferase family protein [Azohydromonas sp.]|uniref:glutathione S-transferase family protein n=1 Tax=Azohydromonas sp. TaxID=1872666 RepID=UPI002D0506FF|nr:glutathione S-transferase family protein [Azohydromonas sp.]HMM85353.1 glutathione S-transferase family protein [Azohydromonas sp.]